MQTDPLTQIWNRESIFRLLDKELARSRRLGGGNGMILADVDHLERLNITFGRQVGDDVLQQVAQRLQSATREEDAVGRFAGGTFLIVLGPCDGFDNFRNVAMRLQRRISARPFELDGYKIPVTLSLGAAFGYVDQGLERKKLLDKAEASLHSARLRGRSCVEVAWVARAERLAPSLAAPHPM